MHEQTHEWSKHRHHRAPLFLLDGKAWCSEMGWERWVGVPHGEPGLGGGCCCESHRSQGWAEGKDQEGSLQQVSAPGGWATLTRRPFAPLMPSGPRDPGGPCGEEKESGEGPF